MRYGYKILMNRILASLVALTLSFSPAIAAQSWAAEDARNASKRGEVISLEKVINKLKKEHGC